ncbi:hypothetical protein BKA65DRAFT_197439 [Rhexocercosporidium sp. MPI-PUGE-AT-0058]|nr:hypothetical protein BKA65DRAFT_197439 [Rhexocercosporidium sp. MPI-PUGE-AT-0058]
MSGVPDDHDQNAPNPGFDWSSIQVSLESMNCDVLILLDTCFAASIITSAQPTGSAGRTEIIAAGGYGDVVFGLSILDSTFFFTHALVEVLLNKARSPVPFTAVILHREILRVVAMRYAGAARERWRLSEVGRGVRIVCRWLLPRPSISH